MERQIRTSLMVLIALFALITVIRVKPAHVVSDAPLADQVDASLNEVTDWSDVVNIGVVMCKSPLSSFDAWIASKADAYDWTGVLAVKRYAEQAGYSSGAVDAAVKLALSNIPMFNNYSLPKTINSSSGYFWPHDRCVLYGYRYAEELNWETDRWSITSGFSALKSVRDWYGRAFYRMNPDIPTADSLAGTRWHESGSLMDSFFIFYKLGVKEALNYAVQEWKWLNNKVWLGDHFSYARSWSNWEFSGISVFPNVAKLHLNGMELDNWSRVVTDLQLRYISGLWSSPQWHETYKVVEHHHTSNAQRRLDGTLNAWTMLNVFYGLFNSGNKTNMKNMLEGNEVKQAWIGLNASDLRQATTDMFRYTSSSSYSAGSTALAALSLFLMGISPQDGKGLAIPLISDKHSCYGSLNYRHFRFDYTNQRIRIPVWGGTTLKFMYGNTPVTTYFEKDGIYIIAFSTDWNSVSQVTKVSNLYPNEYYLWTPESGVTTPTAITILSPENKTYTDTSIPLTFTVNASASWMGYSLDEAANITVTGNSTLTDLSYGHHNITIYVNDTIGNTFSSDGISFSVLPPSPWIDAFRWWIVCAISSLAITLGGILLWRRKVSDKQKVSSDEAITGT